MSHLLSIFGTFFYPNNSKIKNIEKWVEKLTDNRVKILRETHNNHKVTKKELEQAIGISASAIDNNIDILKDLGLLSREGSDKGGYWKINHILP
ncbi:HTH domain-containing protein [Flavobacterium sp. HXWNR69]|uniref:HTH domain-containing protein n=1 Tax=Flavobacterium fragile TaxID=2949085 RepID=A0ABT0TGH9_9FLAO|nr:MarR family transcriptional regulator [Flavobacterium sp. HXWNR69]MCL9769967.1 HTH domain-containing protein [Flavobacterium sp. HXWNR69]